MCLGAADSGSKCPGVYHVTLIAHVVHPGHLTKFTSALNRCPKTEFDTVVTGKWIYCWFKNHHVGLGGFSLSKGISTIDSTNLHCRIPPAFQQEHASLTTNIWNGFFMANKLGFCPLASAGKLVDTVMAQTHFRYLKTVASQRTPNCKVPSSCCCF